MLRLATLPLLCQALQSGSNAILVNALIAEGYILMALHTVLAGYDPQLNERQLVIMVLVLEGRSDREIGAQISIAFDTVRLHLKQV